MFAELCTLLHCVNKHIKPMSVDYAAECNDFGQSSALSQGNSDKCFTSGFRAQRGNVPAATAAVIWSSTNALCCLLAMMSSLNHPQSLTRLHGACCKLL